MSIWSTARFRILRRFVSMAVVGFVALELYLMTALFPVRPPTIVEMPSWVPFVPIFTLPYLGMLLLGVLLPVAIRDDKWFRACVCGFICSFLLVIPFWILAPTILTRPPLPTGWWAGAYRWLAAVDPPNNAMPCAHGLGPIIGAWFLSLDRPRWRWPLAMVLLVGLVSIALVWQHRPLDILVGVVAAAVGVLVGEWWVRRPRTSA